MPNGGPDCCGNCSHNRAVQEMAHPHPDKHEEFWELSHCTLRNIEITNPFWTYCYNFEYGKKPEVRNKQESPKGWVYSSGLYEGYVRIPWNNDVEPLVSVPVRSCEICQRQVDNGIEITHANERIGFCTNYHYIQWWKSINNDPAIILEHYGKPEEIF